MSQTFRRRRFNRQAASLLGAAGLLGSFPALALAPTPRQTSGPFYPVGTPAEADVDLTRLAGHEHSATGEVILVRGRILDAGGQPLANARVDIWQANHWGRYDHPEDRNPAPLDPDFQGIGITRTDTEGRYGFKTIKPAPYPLSAMGDSGMRPRHIHFRVAHESSGDLTTQMYFAGDPLIVDDVVMRGTPAHLRHLLITDAQVDADTGLPLHWFDITLG